MSVKVITRVWDTSKQKRAPLLVMLALADFADDNGYCFPGIESLAFKARVTDRGVKGIISRLVSSGEVLEAKGRGRGNRSVYRVVCGLSKEDIEATNFGPYRLARINVAGGRKKVNGAAISPEEKVNAAAKTAPKKVNGGSPFEEEKVNAAAIKGERSCIALKEEPSVNRQEEDGTTLTADAVDASASSTGRKRDLHFEALAAVCGLQTNRLSPGNRIQLGRQATALRKDGVSPAFIRQCAETWYTKKFRFKDRNSVSPPSVSQAAEWIGQEIESNPRRRNSQAIPESVPRSWIMPNGRSLKPVTTLMGGDDRFANCVPGDLSTYPAEYRQAIEAVEGAVLHG